MTKRKSESGGGYLTRERVRELAGHVFTEQEIAVCAASTTLTEEAIIKAARYKARQRLQQEVYGRTGGLI